MKQLFASLLASLIGYTLVVNGSNTCSEDEILSDGTCYPKLFVPTYEYKKLIEGQTILGDNKLDVQISMKTGEKRAKILVPNAKTEEKSEIYQHSDSTGVNIHESNGRQETFSSYKSKPQIPIEEMSEHQKFAFCAEQIIEYPGSSVKVREALIVLEELVHENEFGVELFKNTVLLKRLLTFLNHEWPSYIRSLVATVLGSALQNNPIAQKEAHKVNLVDSLLASISLETDEETLSHLIYAVSASVRGDLLVLKSFHEAKGLSILSKVYKKHFSKTLDKKIVILVSDINNPDLQPTTIKDSKDSNTEHAPSIAEKEGYNLEYVKDWCDSIQVSFKSHPKEKYESEASALANLVHVYPTTCHIIDGFLTSVKIAIEDVKNSEYYDDYITNLNSLQYWAKKQL